MDIWKIDPDKTWEIKLLDDKSNLLAMSLCNA